MVTFFSESVERKGKIVVQFKQVMFFFSFRIFKVFFFLDKGLLELPLKKVLFLYPSQIWNWFQNRRYALRARGNKAPGKLNVSSSMPPGVDSTNQMRNVLSGILGALYLQSIQID